MIRVLRLPQERLLLLPATVSKSLAPVQRPRLLALVDISGSMGQMVERIVHRALPEMARAMGYVAEDPIELFLFESSPHRQSTTLAQLAQSHQWGCRGGTVLTPSLQQVVAFIRDHSAEDMVLLVFSDGEISDLDQVHVLAHQVHKELQQRARGQLRVLLFRIGGSAATREMSALGLWDNTLEPVPIHDIITGEGVVVSLLDATQKIQIRSQQRICLTTDGPALRLTPDAAYAAEISYVAERGAVVLVDSQYTGTIYQDQAALLLPPVTAPQGLADLETWLDSLASRVRYLLVAGNHVTELDKIADWLKILEDDQKKTESPDVLVLPPSERLKLRKSAKIQRIRELMNQARVAGLNSQMQADFLRGLSQQRTGRRAAVRAGVRDWDQELQQALAGLRTVDRPLPAHWTGLESFLTLGTQRDTVETAFRLARDTEMLQELSALNLLTMVGRVGLPYAGRYSDLPDPWDARRVVQRIYHDCYLSQSDLVIALERAGASEEAPLATASTREPIHGVIPIESDAFIPSVFDEAMAGLCLRRSLVSIPNDTVALVAAGAYRVVEEMVQTGVMSERCVQHLVWLWQELKYRASTKWLNLELNTAQQAKPETLATVLSGTNNVTNFLQPWVSWLVSDDLLLTDTLRDHLTAFELYHAIRATLPRMDVKDHAQERLRVLLGLPTQSLVDVGLPRSPDPDITGVVWAQEPVLDPTLFQKLPLHTRRLLEFSRQINQTLETNPNPRDPLAALLTLRPPPAEGNDEVYMMYMALTQGYMAPTLEDRIDAVTGQLRRPLTSLAGMKEQVLRYMADYNRDLYLQALARKRAQEKEMRIQDDVRRLEEIDSMPEFVEMLNRVAPTRDHPVAQRCLPYLQTAACPDFKRYLFLTGRLPGGSAPVWNKGNVWRCNWKPYLIHCTPQQVAALQEARSKYLRHSYRASNKPNRHGYSNDNPSWWAQGFVSQDEMAQIV